MSLLCQRAFIPLSYNDQNVISMLLDMKGFRDVTVLLDLPHTSQEVLQTAPLRLSDSFFLKEILL